MIYVFDTSSLSNLKHFYPDIFGSVWEGLEQLITGGRLISTREVWNELKRGNPEQHVNRWLKDRKHIFKVPVNEELQFVTKIFDVQRFQNLIGKKQTLKGTPVADPFVISLAKFAEGTVVTEEKFKENAAKIPNVCEYFDIPCINLEQFMQQQGWNF